MNLPIAPLAAGVLGGAVGLCALAVPMPVLEALVMDSGIPAVLAAAEPPLGFTARAGIALAGGGVVALFTWFALSVLVGARGVTIGGAETPDFHAVATPVLRRADAHPDAPPRPPLLATRDLGMPFLDIRSPAEPVAEEPVAERTQELLVEQPLPRDLDQPLSAFDPHAVPDVPMPAPVVLPSLSRAPRPPVFDENERFEVFELTPPVREPAPRLVVRSEEAITRPETEATVHALLERLERGVVRKAAVAPAPVRVERRAKERGLEDALVTLRNLARRA